MRITLLAAFAVLALVLGAGCAGPVDVHVERDEDFGSYRTWDWLPVAARTIDAPTPYAVGLDRDLARLVERELSARGFERVRRGADLRVGALLNVRREEVTVLETRAIEHLSSLHASPSYEVQATVERKETHERHRLVVFAVEPRSGRIVWKGAIEARSRNAYPPRVDGAVAGLLARFPDAGSGAASPSIEALRSEGRPELTATPPPSEPGA